MAAAFLLEGVALCGSAPSSVTQSTLSGPLVTGVGPRDPGLARFTCPTLHHLNQFKSERCWGLLVALCRCDDLYTLRGSLGPR